MSEAFMQRSDSLKRAEQEAQEESECLRQQEREQLAEKRKNDLTLRANLAAKLWCDGGLMLFVVVVTKPLSKRFS